MNQPPVFGDFLGPAAQHITAAASFRSELPDSAQRAAVHRIGRLVMTVSNYLADLPAAPGVVPPVVLYDAGHEPAAAWTVPGRAAAVARRHRPIG